MYKMNILFVIDSFYTTNNGTSISAQRFAGELRKRGHVVRVLCWDTPEDVQRNNVQCTKETLADGDFTLPKFHMPSSNLSATSTISASHIRIRTLFTPLATGRI